MSILKLIDQKSFFEKIGNFVFTDSLSSKTQQPIRTTSSLFDLHSRITCIILFCGFLILSLNEYFGEAINCLQSNSDLPKDLIEKYCWYEGSFVFYDTNPTAQIAYPGITTGEIDSKKLSLKYYQWVHFILLIQIILFYLPKHIWQTSEGRKLEELCVEANKKHINDLNEKDRTKLLQDTYDCLMMGDNSLRLFIRCELFYLIHLIGQVWFLNIFLNGKFISLGYDWLSYNNQQLDYRHDPLVKLFPRLSKCQFHKFGYSGEIERHDALCFLSLNIVNEKIYLTLHFWLYFLILYTIIFLTIRAIYFSLPSLRYKELRKNAPCLKHSIAFKSSHYSGQWFAMRLIGSNMKPSHFAALIECCYGKHFGSKFDISSSGYRKLELTD